MATAAQSPPDTGSPATTTRRKAMFALLALSVGGFGIGLTEFVVAGLLTEVADALGVTISQAGNLVGVWVRASPPPWSPPRR